MPVEIILVVMFNQMVNSLTAAWNGTRTRRQQWTQHSENMGFQKERFEKEKEHQKNLEQLRRETQLQVAREKLQETLRTREVSKMFDTWPLKLVPSQYLMSDMANDRVPLKIIVAPTEGENLSGLWLEQGLRDFLKQHYPLHDDVRPVEFLGGAWDKKNIRSETGVKAMFSMLRPAPTLILESQLIDGDLHLFIGYWGIAQQGYCFQHAAKFPYNQLLIEKARQFAREWEAIRERLRAQGLSPEEAEKYGGTEAENLKVYEEEERIKGLIDHDVGRLNFSQRYKINERHHASMHDEVISMYCLIAACIIDIYYLLHYDVRPALPQRLPHLIKSLPEAQVALILNDLVVSYCAAYEALEADRPAWVPDLSLDLAQSLAVLPNKCWAERQVERSIREWLRLREVPDLGIDDSLQQLRRLLTPEDKDYVTKLKHSLLAIGHDARAAQLDAVC